MLLMWAVCWSDTKEISLTTCSAGPHYVNIILDIFWHLRYIFIHILLELAVLSFSVAWLSY
jgi:hypothetical protein